MNTVRIAVILMTLQRYFALVVNFAMVAIVSRLLRPEEFGLAMGVGWASGSCLCTSCQQTAKTPGFFAEAGRLVW